MANCHIIPEDRISPRDFLDRVINAATRKKRTRVSKPQTEEQRKIHRAKMAEWRKANPEKTKKTQDKWHKGIDFERRLQLRLYQYKHKCNRRSFKWLLTDEEAMWFMASPCHYCHQPPIEAAPNGLDRIDNSPVYDLDCVVPCCAQCNRAKGKMSYDSFQDWLGKIVKAKNLQE